MLQNNKLTGTEKPVPVLFCQIGLIFDILCGIIIKDYSIYGETDYADLHYNR